MFNKEISQKGFKYRLYFASLPCSGVPRPDIRRLISTRRKDFNSAALGKVYDISYKKNFLKAMYETGEEIISEADYQKLIDRRDRIFKRDQTVSAFRRLHAASASGGNYYTFEEFRQLASYRPEPAYTAFCHTVHSLCVLICLILPAVVFSYSLFWIFSRPQPSLTAYTASFWRLPVYYFASVPFLIYLMTLFTVLAESALMRIDRFRWMILKRHAYLTGGMRRGVTLHRAQKYRLLWYGLITGGLYLVILLLVLL